MRKGTRVQVWYFGEYFEGTIIEDKKVKLDRGLILSELPLKSKAPKGSPWYIVKRIK
jgi:hypothetical protein